MTETVTYSINVTQTILNEDVRGCLLYPGEDAKCLALKYTKLVSSVLSIIGSLLTVGIVVLFKKYQEFAQRMIANLSLASMFVGISYLLDEFEEDATPLCIIQGAVMTFSVWSTLMWVMCIVANLYIRVIFDYDWKRWEAILTVLCWAIPLVVMSLPFIGSAYGPAGVWCWIVNDVGWRFGVWYIWDILSVFIFAFAMVHIVYKLLKTRRMRRSEQSVFRLKTLHADIQILRLYPLVYFLVNMFPIIGRLEDAIRGYSFGVLLLHAFFGPLFGAANVLVFVFDRKTSQLLNVKDIHDAVRNWRKSKTQVREYHIGGEFRPIENCVETDSAM